MHQMFLLGPLLRQSLRGSVRISHHPISYNHSRPELRVLQGQVSVLEPGPFCYLPDTVVGGTNVEYMNQVLSVSTERAGVVVPLSPQVEVGIMWQSHGVTVSV